MTMTKRTNSATARLKQDYLRIKKDPLPYAVAEPVPTNILEWHYVIKGPENTTYAGGIYHGKLIFPSEFPYKPPSIYMITPNGRFKCNSRLCLSISDYHPEYWNPAWSVSTILTGLLSFMMEKNPTLGSIETSKADKTQLALKSGEFNLKNKTFCELFPTIAEEIKAELQRRKATEKSVTAALVGSANNESDSNMNSVENHGLAGSAWTNLCVILGFAAFAFTVKYVLRLNSKTLWVRMASCVNEDKELLISDSIRREESIASLESSSMSITLYSHLSNFERHPTYTHVCQVLTLVTLATVINICFPFYLTTINERSDVYFSLLFTSICSVVILFLIIICLKIQNRDRSVFPPISILSLWKLGTYLGVSCLLIYFSRDRNRVQCYLQDPLAAVSLPLAVVFHFLRSRKVDSTRKLLCIAAAIIGLFICIDFQIWDEFTCHGHPNDFATDAKLWTLQEHSIWTIVYIAGLGLFAYFLTLLDREIKTCKPECHIATIALAHSSPNTNDFTDDVNMVLLPPQETSSEYKLIPEYHIWTLAFWLHFWSLSTVLVFVWTDFFPFLGKAGPDFRKYMFEGFLCHFSISEACGNILMFSWSFIIAIILLSVCLLSLMINSHTSSVPYIMAVLMTALPTSSLFWSLFKSDGAWQWSPNFTGETGFALVGLPILISSLTLYRYYAKMESQID
uniref:Ubiquitin-conjugating enzyme E2 J2 n=1 Tax=Strigamia maritima TaxID=126957 RepID=T1IVE4_STRMM